MHENVLLYVDSCVRKCGSHMFGTGHYWGRPIAKKLLLSLSLSVPLSYVEKRQQFNVTVNVDSCPLVSFRTRGFCPRGLCSGGRFGPTFVIDLLIMEAIKLIYSSMLFDMKYLSK